MSRQAETVQEIIQIVADCGVPVGMVLGGSVAQGCERDDSDLDFLAVADASRQPDLPGFSVLSEKNGCKVLERDDGRFPIHVACWTAPSMEEILRAKPYMMYPFIQGRIVHDPTGIAWHYQARIQEYFETHPRLTAAWAKQLGDLRHSRSRSDEELAFPQWSDFVRHIEDAFADEIAEPSVPGDA